MLIAAGVLAITDAGLTVAWQEPVTALRAALDRGALTDELRALERIGPTRTELRALAAARTERRRIALLARGLERRARSGQAVGRITIPRLGLRTVVVKGSGAAELRRGPGLYDGQPFPGAGGTAAVAGHRTTFGAPFSELDRLRRGDRVTVRMPYATMRYEVVRSRIVLPTEVSVLRDLGRERLVLSACHPRFSAAKRIVVEARLVEQASTPVSQARQPA